MMTLLNAYSAEQQAIAIYKAEVFWRPGKSGQIFRTILAEEEAHQRSMDPFMASTGIIAVIAPFNFMAGWLLGTFLSLLPRNLCYRIHVWAEIEAAKTYEMTLQKMGKYVPSGLGHALTEAAHQERDHARRFEDLLAAPAPE